MHSTHSSVSFKNQEQSGFSSILPETDRKLGSSGHSIRVWMRRKAAHISQCLWSFTTMNRTLMILYYVVSQQCACYLARGLQNFILVVISRQWNDTDTMTQLLLFFNITFLLPRTFLHSYPPMWESNTVVDMITSLLEDQNTPNKEYNRYQTNKEENKQTK